MLAGNADLPMVRASGVFSIAVELLARLFRATPDDSAGLAPQFFDLLIG